MRPVPSGTIQHSPRRRRVAPFLVACAAVFAGFVAPASGRLCAAQGRRVVDVVSVGDPRSERDHEYAGEDVAAGAIGGSRFIQTRGWLRYSLTTYDDTEVTVRCTFRGSEGQRLSFELLVEGRFILTHTFVSASAAPSTVDLPVPISVTRGKTAISVTIRAVNGPTPGLISLQTVQEHLERPAW